MASKLPARLGLILGAMSGAFGCGPPPPAAPAPPRVEPRTAAPLEPRLPDTAWGVRRLPRLGLKLALPDARGWTENAPSGSVWQLRHVATGTTLSLRRWRASRLPQVGVCDNQLRQRMPGLVSPDETNLVAEREVRVPQGFVTRITLLSLPGGSPRRLGQAVAVGAGVGECLAVVALTETSSDVELADRLRLLDAVLGHLRLTHVEDRVPDRAPLAP